MPTVFEEAGSNLCIDNSLVCCVIDIRIEAEELKHITLNGLGNGTYEL